MPDGRFGGTYRCCEASSQETEHLIEWTDTVVVMAYAFLQVYSPYL